MFVDEKLSMTYQYQYQYQPRNPIIAWAASREMCPAGDSFPLLCSPSGKLHPILSLLAQEIHGAVRAGPEESYQVDQG